MKLMLITILMLIARLVLLLMNIQVSIPTENFCLNHAVRNQILTKGECMLIEVVQLSFTVLRTVRVQLILKS